MSNPPIDTQGRIRRLVEESYGRFIQFIEERDEFPSWEHPLRMPVQCPGISPAFDEIEYSVLWGNRDNLMVGQAVSISNPDPDLAHCFSMLTLDAPSKEELLSLLSQPSSLELFYHNFLRLVEELYHV